MDFTVIDSNGNVVMYTNTEDEARDAAAQIGGSVTHEH
jgi:hypothetical protein